MTTAKRIVSLLMHTEMTFLECVEQEEHTLEPNGAYTFADGSFLWYSEVADE